MKPPQKGGESGLAISVYPLMQTGTTAPSIVTAL
jgi:hypothetical protein